MIVDSSALIAILRDEPDGARFRRILEVRCEILISAGTLIEARVMAISLNILDELNELVDELAIRAVPVDERQATIAAEASVRYGKGRHPARLNFGDLFAYSLAKLRNEPLLFKGGDFAKTDLRAAV
jgi:ribonuclease VapC